MRVARRYVIAGRVQGVGFRWFTARRRRPRRGARLGAQPRGRQRRSRGRRGPAESVDRLEAAVRRGPASARVERFDVEELAPDRAPSRIRDQMTHGRAQERASATCRTSPSPASSSTTSPRCCATRQGFKLAIDSMAEPYQGKGISLVVGIESRGFILGAAVADRIGAGFVPVRKVGKLPAHDDPRHLRPRIRHRQPRDAQRRDRARARRS